jgi:hypothetical protein
LIGRGPLMRTRLLLFLLPLLLVAAAHSQTDSVHFCWIGSELHLWCDRDLPASDGNWITLMHDYNGNGSDWYDPVANWITYDWNAQGRPWIYCSEPIAVDTGLYYLRGYPLKNCWISGDFRIEPGQQQIFIDDWTCIPWSCYQTFHVSSPVIRFAGGLANMGCPCEYPLALSPGATLELRNDFAYDGPSPDDAVISSFRLEPGSGLPPWNGFWTPVVESAIPDGYYYIKLQSNACCWVSAYLDFSDADTLTLADTSWACGTECRRYPCAGPPPPPQDVLAQYSNAQVWLQWDYQLPAQHYVVYLDGAELMVIPGYLRLWGGYYALPGQHTFWMTALTSCGMSDVSNSDTVWVPDGRPQLLAPPPATAEYAIASHQAETALTVAPNPFNAQAGITFELMESGPARLVLFDILGRQVATLADGAFDAGTHRVQLNGGDLPSGIYVLGLISAAQVDTRKLLLLK